MATKRAKYTMMPTPDPFIQQGFGQEKITLNHKNITEENNYIKLRLKKFINWKPKYNLEQGLGETYEFYKKTIK